MFTSILFALYALLLYVFYSAVVLLIAVNIRVKGEGFWAAKLMPVLLNSVSIQNGIYVFSICLGFELLRWLSL